MVVLRAPWIESRPASRTRIFAANILHNRQSLLTFPAEYRLILALVLAPNHRWVPSQLLVAMDAGIKRVAALEFHRHNIAVRVVVRTLSVLIDAETAHHHLTRHKLSYRWRERAVLQISMLKPSCVNFLAGQWLAAAVIIYLTDQLNWCILLA
jgi:hypothetical protein